MSHPRIVSASLLLMFSGMTATVAHAAAATKADTPEAIFARDIKPFLIDHCIDCHDDGTAEAGLRIDLPELQTVESMRTHRDTWERILTKVSHAVMPPPKREQPDAADRSRMVTSLDKVLHPIDPAKPDAGRVVLRRLNREEYKNTVQDVLGVTFDPAADFPADDSGYGYDNIGDVLTLSPLLFERYLSAAKAIARDVVPERAAASRVIFGSPDLFKGDGVVLLTPTLKYERATRTSWTFTVPATGMYKLASAAGSGTGEGATGVIRYNVEIDGVVVGKELTTGTGTRDTSFEQTMPEVKLTKGTHTLVVDWFTPQPPLPTPAGAPTPAAAPGHLSQPQRARNI